MPPFNGMLGTETSGKPACKRGLWPGKQRKPNKSGHLTCLARSNSFHWTDRITRWKLQAKVAV